MCLSPFWRFPIPPYALKHSGAQLKGYKNGAFVFSKKQVDKLEWLCACYPERVVDLIEIPCGQCIECRIDYSKQWAQRCICEAQMSERNSYFITLTYDDEHLPCAEFSFPFHTPPGVVINEPVLLSPLHQDDMTLFLKRLRINLERKYGIDKIRFFYCGEYGETTHRPHFHLLLFNVDFPDLEFAFKTDLLSGETVMYYQSEFLSDTWGKGFISISPLTWENAAYTCRYVMKKRMGLSKTEYLELCSKAGVKPLPFEFTCMSRRPGLACAYFNEYKGFIYEFDKVYLPKGRECKPARYFDKLYDLQFPEAFEFIKQQRDKKASSFKLSQALYSPISEEASIKNRASRLKNTLKKLKREL